MLLRRPQDQNGLTARALALREAARRKVAALEARWRKRRQPLERAHAEFLRNLEHLRALAAEGRYPQAQLSAAILREELRLRHLEEEMRRMDEGFRLLKERVYREARLRVARLAARSGQVLELDALFPEVKDEPSGHTAEHQG